MVDSTVTHLGSVVGSPRFYICWLFDTFPTCVHVVFLGGGSAVMGEAPGREDGTVTRSAEVTLHISNQCLCVCVWPKLLCLLL